MQIIELTKDQFKNYANLHHTKSFGQTYEYSNLIKNELFLGMIDNSNNLYAAVLLNINNISPKIKEAYAKDGFIIDYTNIELLKEFINELKIYLKKRKITYLITDPKFHLYTYNKDNSIEKDNNDILSTFLNLGFIKDTYQDDFSKYNVIINNNNINNIYKNFSRHTKRNIKENINMGITLHKASIKDIDTFYEIIKKKTKKNNSYYYNLMNTYNTKDNKMEIFFTKLNPQKFLINTKKLYEKEVRKNEAIHNTIKNKMGKMTEKILNKKINSDSLLEKYKELLNKAINFSKNNEESVIVGTCAIIRNNKEIYFLIDGYKESFRSIHSSHILKWALIKKYSLLGYKTFNLGEIHKEYLNKTSKYHGQYMYKIGFGGNIIEYPPTLLLVINKPLYNTYIKMNKIKNKLKLPNLK